MKKIINSINFMNGRKMVLENVMHLKIKENYIKNYDEFFYSTKEYILEIIKLFLYFSILNLVFFQKIILVFLSIPIILIIPFFNKTKYIKNRKKELLLKFKDFIMILSSYLDSSYSIENSFFLAKDDLVKMHGNNNDFHNELVIMCKQIKMNKPIEIIFKNFSDKTKIEDINDFSEIFFLAKRNGANMNNIISSTIKIIKERIELENNIKTITAEKQFEQKIMNFLPLFIILFLNFTSKDFLNPMYNTILGNVIMLLMFFLYIFSIYISNKILDIEL